MATIVYLCVFNIKDAGKVVNNPYNKRVDSQEAKVIRGDILSDDGTVLATTLLDEDGNEKDIIHLMICSVILLDSLLLPE